MLLAAAFLALSQAAAAPAPPLAQHLVTRPHLFALPDGAVGYIPASASPHPPLLVLLHGAGHEQATMVEHFEAEADQRGLVLLAPDSRGVTWDKVLDAEAPLSVDSPITNAQSHSFSRSPDADRVEKAIADLAKILPVDRTHTVLAGFSDGATFALAMGMSRDHPFAAVIAWSPGIAIRTLSPARGRRVYISHGRADPLLRFDTTCNDIVPLVKSEGGEVTFLPFDGGHVAPVWVKDSFLDAVFGKVAGSQARPVPAEATACVGGRAETPM